MIGACFHDDVVAAEVTAGAGVSSNPCEALIRNRSGRSITGREGYARRLQCGWRSGRHEAADAAPAMRDIFDAQVLAPLWLLVVGR